MPINNLKYSLSGQQLTEKFEGFRSDSYQDQVGVWTIGYGHIRGVTEGMTCTQEQALAWLDEDMARCVADVNQYVTVPLTQGEFDALCDFAFNLGDGSLNNSTLLRELNDGDYRGAAAQFEVWDHAGGKVVAGLLRRRIAEENEFKGIVIDPEISV
jgi:lysozyme